jgi:hypothetical protein
LEIESDEFCSKQAPVNGHGCSLTTLTFNAPVDASMDCLAGIDRHYVYIALPIRTYTHPPLSLSFYTTVRTAVHTQYPPPVYLIRVQILSLAGLRDCEREGQLQLCVMQ